MALDIRALDSGGAAHKRKSRRNTVKRFYETAQTDENRPTHYVKSNIYGALVAWLVWNIDGDITPDWSYGIEIDDDLQLCVHTKKDISDLFGTNKKHQAFSCGHAQNCVVYKISLNDIYKLIRMSVPENIRNDYNSMYHPESLFVNSTYDRYEEFFCNKRTAGTSGFDFKIHEQYLLFELIQQIIFEGIDSVFL